MSKKGSGGAFSRVPIVAYSDIGNESRIKPVDLVDTSLSPVLTSIMAYIRCDTPLPDKRGGTLMESSFPLPN
jgi:hypothetical protein